MIFGVFRGRWKPSGRGGTKLWRLLPPGEAEEGLSIPSDQHQIHNAVVTGPFRQAVLNKYSEMAILYVCGYEFVNHWRRAQQRLDEAILLMQTSSLHWAARLQSQ
eukprot:scaffold325252_cov26-Prasinocladus_malaysianus.AAC.1